MAYTLSSLTSVSPLLLSLLSLSVGTEKARIIPPVDFHLTAFELSLTEASSHSQAVHEAQVAQTYGVSCKEGDVRDREKKKNCGERRLREGVDKQDEGLCFEDSKQVQCLKSVRLDGKQ